jgi:hypothetical protein
MPILIAAAAVFSVMNIATGTIAGKGTDTEKQAAGMVDPIDGSEARAFAMTNRKGKHGVEVHGSKMVTRRGQDPVKKLEMLSIKPGDLKK